MSELIYLDTETTGLNPARHSVWEIAYADERGTIAHSFVEHSLENAEAIALEIGGYWKRYSHVWDTPSYSTVRKQRSVEFEDELKKRLVGATVIGANPAFDAKMLEARWGIAPWHYRLLDIETYAMPYFGWNKPKGMKSIFDGLTAEGYPIPEPDHTAAGDVAALRVAHQTLRALYDNLLTANRDY